METEEGIAFWARVHEFEKWTGVKKQSWDEWQAGLLAAPNKVQFMAHLGTALDAFGWRIQAVFFLFDIIDHEEQGLVWKEIASKPWSKNERGDNHVRLPEGIKQKAAEMLVLDYLKSSPPDTPDWAYDTAREPKILPGILRMCRGHRTDFFFSLEHSHARSAVKKFIKLCFGDWQWHADRRRFLAAVDASLVDLYRTVFAFGMGDLVTRWDDLSLKALEEVIFGPRDEHDKADGKAELPQNLNQALAGGNVVRHEAAMRLVALRAVKNAEHDMNYVARQKKSSQP